MSDKIKEFYAAYRSMVDELEYEVQKYVLKLGDIRYVGSFKSFKDMRIKLGYVEYQVPKGPYRTKDVIVTKTSTIPKIQKSIKKFHDDHVGLKDDPARRLKKFWTPWINNHLFVDQSRSWTPSLAMMDWIDSEGNIVQKKDREEVIQIPGVKPLIPMWFVPNNSGEHYQKINKLRSEHNDLRDISGEITDELKDQINSGIAEAKKERGVNSVGKFWKERGYGKTSCRIFYSPTDDEFFAANNSEGFSGAHRRYSSFTKDEEIKAPDATVVLDLTKFPELRKRLIASAKRNIINKYA